MSKLKAALVDSYVGAILIALIASNGLTNLIQPIFTLIGEAVAASKGSRSTYGSEVAVLVFAHAFAYLVIAFLLLRWLYFTSDAVPGELPGDTEGPVAE